MQGLYRSACDPFFNGCTCCLTCPLSCNGSGCKNCLNVFSNNVFDGLCGESCIGYPSPLCGCCANCPLCWYAGCCEYCYIADLSVAAGGGEEKWKDVAYPLVFWYVMSQIIQNIANMFKAGSGGQQAFSTIYQIIEALLHISACVMFGKAATSYAVKKQWAYEGQACCEACGFSLGCDDCGCGTSLTLWCCLTYVFCFQCHFVQVGRSMEKDSESVGLILKGRPDKCAKECCNCWNDDVLGTSNTTGSAQAP